MIVIRNATLSDEEAILRIGGAIHAESRYASHSYDETCVREFFRRAIVNSSYVVLVAEMQEGVVGFVAGFIQAYLFCKEKMARDICLCVDKRFRGSKAAVQLVRSLQVWAAQMGAAELVISTSTMIDPTRTERFFSRLNFAPIGQVHTFGLTITKEGRRA